MRFTYRVTVDVERQGGGKFALREEIAAKIEDALNSAAPDFIDDVGSDGVTTYEVIEWKTEEVAQ